MRSNAPELVRLAHLQRGQHEIIAADEHLRAAYRTLITVCPEGAAALAQAIMNVERAKVEAATPTRGA